jgi:hypothetical protein
MISDCGFQIADFKRCSNCNRESKIYNYFGASTPLERFRKLVTCE